MERASVRLASRCGGGRPIRLHLSATFAKRYTTTRPNPPSTTATARESHARALHARARVERAN
eukprot:5305672-Lingulodinium_polyedra.AAC.1